MNVFLSIISGGVSGGLLVWILRNWFLERLQQSVRHEYSEKLETHKAELKAQYDTQLERYRAELTSRIQSISHERELDKLRRSLFFEHQREAFASLLGKVAEVKEKWRGASDEESAMITVPVPEEQRRGLLDMLNKNLLFLDDSSLMAMELVIDVLNASLPIRMGDDVYNQDCDLAFDKLDYLQPRISALFRSKLGLGVDQKIEEELALYGAISLLNNYHFRDINLPPKETLRLDARDLPADAVGKAQRNRAVLISKLKEFSQYLSEGGKGDFHYASVQASRYLEVLEEKPNKGPRGTLALSRDRP